MDVQNHETSNGWPLGLRIMSMKLRLQDTGAPAVEPSSLHISSSSFSSFFSSNLDAESSASYFQDNSVSLGKLIGCRQGDRGSSSLYLQNTLIHTEQSNRLLPVSSGACSCKDVSTGNRHSADMCQGICIPLILGALVKIISRYRSKSNSD